MFNSFVPTGLMIKVNNPRGILASNHLGLSHQLAAKFDEKGAHNHIYVIVAYDVIPGDTDPLARVTLLPENLVHLSRFRIDTLLKNHPADMWMKGPSLSEAHVNVVGLHLDPFIERQGKTRAQFELSALTSSEITLPAVVRNKDSQTTIKLSGIALRKTVNAFQSVALGKGQRRQRTEIPFGAEIVDYTRPCHPREMFEFGINRPYLDWNRLRL